MLNETWKDQHERLKRSRALFKQVGEQTLMPQEIIPGRDVAYHFCCDALHLRDWIAAAIAKPQHRSIKQKKQIMEGIKQKIMDELFTPSRELSACADIANGSKHLLLTGPSYMTGQRGEATRRSRRRARRLECHPSAPLAATAWISSRSKSTARIAMRRRWLIRHSRHGIAG